MDIQEAYKKFCEENDTTISFNCFTNIANNYGNFYKFFMHTNSYARTLAFYRGKRANRSNVPYMNHIIEGMYILLKINADRTAILSYILHPIFQSDEDVVNASSDLLHLSPINILLAMEYRYIANSYLSFRKINDISEIKLSPFKEVNDMLIADKIQNRKDFDLYHLNHERHKELDEYFTNWLKRLDISEEFYQEVVSEIS